MNENYMEHNNHDEIKKPVTRWPEIITLFLGIVTFLIYIEKENHRLVIIPIIFLVLSIIFTARDWGLFRYIGKKYHLRKQNRMRDNEARKRYPRFVQIVTKSEVFRELMDCLRRTEWINRDAYSNLEYIIFVNWFNDISATSKRLRIGHLDEMRLIAQRFRDFLNIFNEYYIVTFSTAFRLGNAKYPDEFTKKTIIQLKRRYDALLIEYNDLCKEFNDKCGDSLFVPIYLPPDLDWEKGNKI